VVSGRRPGGIRAAISAAAAIGARPGIADRGRLSRAAAWWTLAVAASLAVFGLGYLTWHNWLLGGLSLACALSALSRCAWKLALLSALGRCHDRRPPLPFLSAAAEPGLNAVDRPDPARIVCGPGQGRAASQVMRWGVFVTEPGGRPVECHQWLGDTLVPLADEQAALARAGEIRGRHPDWLVEARLTDTPLPGTFKETFAEFLP
jgi:hypothetical protein